MFSWARKSQVTCFWWEIAEMLRKFLLVGLFVVIEPGSVTQIALATIVTAVFLLVQLQSKPYKSASDDFLASAASFALLMLFICSIIYKYVELTDTEDVFNKMSLEQQQDYGVPAVFLSVILTVSVIGAIVVAAALVTIEVAIKHRNLAKLRRLKYITDGSWVLCKPLADPQAFHLFRAFIYSNLWLITCRISLTLAANPEVCSWTPVPAVSHAWPAAQDRMRIVKARFLEALPSCRTFLDVDDLKSGSGTAEVDKSECILVFCTSQVHPCLGPCPTLCPRPELHHRFRSVPSSLSCMRSHSSQYFEKKNSLKELYRAVVQRRPILAMLEPDASQEGGLDQAAIEALVTNAKLDKFKLRKKWDEWRADGDLLPAAFDHAPDEVEVRAALFAIPPVEWNRLPHFQDVTIRLIAQNGILGGKPGRQRRRSSFSLGTHAARSRGELLL